MQTKRTTGRPVLYTPPPDWYQPIQNQIAHVREAHGPSIAHFEECIAIGELLGTTLDPEEQARIRFLLHEVDRLKVELRAAWLAEEEARVARIARGLDGA